MEVVKMLYFILKCFLLLIVMDMNGKPMQSALRIEKQARKGIFIF